MAEIFYQDAEFGRAINTMTEIAEELMDAGNAFWNSIGGELGPSALVFAIQDVGDQWRAGSVALADEAAGIATKIVEEVRSYDGMDKRAEKAFIEAMHGIPISDRSQLPDLPAQHECSPDEEILRG